MSDTVLQHTNSKYAWRELAHKGLPKRSAPERVADFLEIYGLYDEATAREQASRCIQCPNPSCVTGCPLCNPIPEWMRLTAEGRFLDAAAVLGTATNMAEICARVCATDRLCEGSCILNGVSEPVSIGAIEQNTPLPTDRRMPAPPRQTASASRWSAPARVVWLAPTDWPVWAMPLPSSTRPWCRAVCW